MHQFSKQPSSFTPSNNHSSLFKSRPFSPETTPRSASGQDRDLKEVFQLQLKKDSGEISQVQQERLTYLQGKITNNLFKKQSRIQRYYSDHEIHFADSPAYLPVQRKLTVGEPNDKYEQEADRVASVVVEQINAPAQQTKSNPSLQREDKEDEEVQTKLEISSLQRQEDLVEEEKKDLQTKQERQPLLRYTGNKLSRYLQPLPYFEKPHPTPAKFSSTAYNDISSYIQRLEEDRKKEALQTKRDLRAIQKQTEEPEEKEENLELRQKSILQRAEETAGAEVTEDIESTINNALGSGQSLDANLQKSMGQAMDADFSRVKVHTDSTADQLNKSVQARAFTTGQDVFFKQGEYNPGSKDGQELIAHELTHVVQQNGRAVQIQGQQKDSRPNPVAVHAIHRMIDKDNNTKLKNLHSLNEALKKLNPSISGIDLSMLETSGADLNLLNTVISESKSTLYDGMKRADVLDELKPSLANLVNTEPKKDSSVELEWQCSEKKRQNVLNYTKLVDRLTNPDNYNSETGEPQFNNAHYDNTKKAEWKLQADQAERGSGSVDRLHINVNVSSNIIKVTVVDLETNTH